MEGGEAGPIFVVGPSRSGTSLVQSILNAHSGVWVTHETHYFDDLRVRLAGRARSRLNDADRQAVEQYFLKLAHQPYGHEGDPSQSHVDAGELRADAQLYGGTADSYFEAYCRLRLRRYGRSRWGEKTPRHAFRIDEMLAVWPSAKVVCLVRDPRAVVASYRDWKRGKKASTAADRKRVLRSYNVVVTSLLWKAAMQAVQQALRRHGPDRVSLLRYERLVAQPEGAVKELSEWLELGYEPGMLDVPIVRSSYTDAVEGISTAPLERWRSKLSPTEISVIQTCCGRVMEELGYAREPVAAPARELIATWATVPLAFARAALANRSRLGKAPEYIRKRVLLALSRGGS